jgi:RNA polymerase sigma factor (sigma-70 family)
MFRHAGAFTAEGRDGAATDAELLRSYQSDGNSAAFAALVLRHGPMVWGVCRNTLGEADAEDAFQATFLALIRSGATIRDPASVGGWLHRVAVQVCNRSKRDVARRWNRDAGAAVPEATRPDPDFEWQELHAAVHAAIDRLPDRLRTVFVLCGLEGVRPTDAATRLGVRVGTVTCRLTRARQRILTRLKGRGLVPGLVSGVALAATGSMAAVPFALLDRVITLTRPDGPAGVSSVVLSLARSATEVPMVRLKVLVAIALVGTAVTASVGGRFLATTAAQDKAGRLNPPDLSLPVEQKLPTENSSLPPPVTGQPSLRGSLTDPNAALTTAPRQKWEYRVTRLRQDAQAELNDLGAEGWELVTIDRNTAGVGTAYLKRVKASEDTSAVNQRKVYAGSGLRLTLPASSQEEAVTIRLKTITATAAASVVATLYGKEAGFSGATPEERTNSLILTGSPEKLKEVLAMIEKIDAAKSSKEPEPAR